MSWWSDVASNFRAAGYIIINPPNFPVLGRSGSAGQTDPATNNLARIFETTHTIEVGNPLTTPATVSVRVRRLDIPPEWIVAVTPTEVTLQPGQQVTATVTINPGSAAVQGTRARVAIEGYAGGQLLGGVVLDVVVPSASPTTTIELASGWNLISLSLVPEDTDPAKVLASIAGKYSIAFAYDPSKTNPWLVYGPDFPPSLNTLQSIDVSKAFWLNMKEPTNLIVKGTQPERTEIAIAPGWNFIGYPSNQTRPVAELLAGVTFDSLWAYDPSGAGSWQVFNPSAPQQLNTLQKFTPGRGYALQATAAAVITVSNPGTVLPTGPLAR